MYIHTKSVSISLLTTFFVGFVIIIDAFESPQMGP